MQASRLSMAGRSETGLSTSLDLGSKERLLEGVENNENNSCHNRGIGSYIRN